MTISRRECLIASAAYAGGIALGKPTLAAPETAPRGKAEHVISIWLGGGMGQIDTFDPKAKGDPAKRVAGAYYDSVDTAVPGVQLCEHLSRLAPLMDRVTVVRTVNHDMIDEHAAATNRMHTGRPISGTVMYPSIGSLVTHERGAVTDNAPPYVLIGYPNITRGPGFLGAQDGYLYLTDTTQGPAGLSRPEGIGTKRQTRREAFLATLKRNSPPTSDDRLRDYDSRSVCTVGGMFKTDSLQVRVPPGSPTPLPFLLPSLPLFPLLRELLLPTSRAELLVRRRRGGVESVQLHLARG